MIMDRIMRRGLLWSVLSALSMASCQMAFADTINVEFIPEAEPAPTVSFTLLSNGEIEGQFDVSDSSTFGLRGMGISTPGGTMLPQSNFSFIPTSDASWVTPNGTFSTGLTPSAPFPRSGTWDIGVPGEFTSVSQLFAPNSDGFEVFAAVDTAHYGIVPAVPLPIAGWLLASGLCLLAAVTRHNRSWQAF
jgi:hypothetical protein